VVVSREFELNLSDWNFWGNLSRRGTHVSTLKNGSRGGKKCFGGISGFYAVLRRELVGRN
jgi:hypothetical protein